MEFHGMAVGPRWGLYTQKHESVRDPGGYSAFDDPSTEALGSSLIMKKS